MFVENFFSILIMPVAFLAFYKFLNYLNFYFLIGSTIKQFDTNILSFNINKTTSGTYKCIGFNNLGKLEKTITVNYYGKYYYEMFFFL